MKYKALLKTLVDPIFYQAIYTYVFLKANENGVLHTHTYKIATRFGINTRTVENILLDLAIRGFLKLEAYKSAPQGRITKQGRVVTLTVKDYMDRKKFLETSYPQAMWEIPIDFFNK